MPRSIALMVGVLAWAVVSGAGHAATLPAGFAESQVAASLTGVTAMTFAPDGRLFVCQQDGRLRVIKNGVLLPTPFATLPVQFLGERGLIGVAVDPDFAVNQYVYVHYTATTPAIHNRVSRLIADGDVAIPGSETVILDLDPLSSVTHNGGAIHFGADGKLYVAVGDDANPGNAQALSNRFGKVLRINPDGSIPPDNPFHATADGPNRAIWVLGLRNPFSFAVQPGSGRLFINDVGQDTWEEIDEGVAGSNYGWPVTEGPTGDPRYRGPLHAYSHGDGSCAITGGVFYNPPNVQFPGNYVGSYFFADYCGGWIRRFDPATGAVTGFATGIDAPIDLKVAGDGSLYYLSLGLGAVYRVRYTGSEAPSIGTQPADQTAPVGGSATFTVGASGTPPLGYQWQRNGTPIPGATSASYTLAPVSAADQGASFRAVVSNAFGTATSNAATLTVTANGPPTATMTLPAAGALYSAGDTIHYAGIATDPEQGALPPNAYTWTVVFHHDTHTHPFLPAASGATSGSFVIPAIGETETNVWYRIHLTVTDAGGLTHTTFQDVRPRTVTLGLATSPPGLRVTLDGQPRATPEAVHSVVGMIRTLGVVSPQTVGGVRYEFLSWSDGGAATHDIATPPTDAGHTATFRIASAITLGVLDPDLSAGEPLVVRGAFLNTGAPTSVDAYLGIVLTTAFSARFGCAPGVVPIAFLTAAEATVVCGDASPATFPALARNVTFPSIPTPTVVELLNVLIPPGIPPSTLTVFLALTVVDAFADGVLDPGDVLMSDLKTVNID